MPRKTQTTSFGSVVRESHSSKKFYSSKLFEEFRIPKKIEFKQEEVTEKPEQSYEPEEAEDEQEPEVRETETEEKTVDQSTGKMDIRFHETGVLPEKKEVKAAAEAARKEKETRGKKIFGQQVLVQNTSELQTARVTDKIESGQSSEAAKPTEPAGDGTIELIDL